MPKNILEGPRRFYPPIRLSFFGLHLSTLPTQRDRETFVKLKDPFEF